MRASPKQDLIMEFRDTYERWKQTQAAAAEAEARLNRRISEFLEDRGTLPDRKDFLEVRFLRNTSAELLEQAVTAKSGNISLPCLQPAYPTGVPSEAPAAPARLN
jgi:hypothetical protein